MADFADGMLVLQRIQHYKTQPMLTRKFRPTGNTKQLTHDTK